MNVTFILYSSSMRTLHFNWIRIYSFHWLTDTIRTRILPVFRPKTKTGKICIIIQLLTSTNCRMQNVDYMLEGILYLMWRVLKLGWNVSSCWYKQRENTEKKEIKCYVFDSVIFKPDIYIVRTFNWKYYRKMIWQKYTWISLYYVLFSWNKFSSQWKVSVSSQKFNCICIIIVEYDVL